MFPSLTLELPSWVSAQIEAATANGPLRDIEERMLLVIELSARNIREGSGGPFGAAIFDAETHELIAPGVNLVSTSHASIAHAEILAMSIAQQRLADFDLSQQGKRRMELVTSSEPCAMCFGAIPWAGLSQIVCGARAEDVCAIGFDEGDKPLNWVDSLSRRGIAVQRDLCRERAVSVLQEYSKSSGLIYNGN
jgi:tRNA(Arg) A34 adenosine deaminase TadA